MSQKCQLVRSVEPKICLDKPSSSKDILRGHLNCKVRLSGEIGGVEILKKTNFIITIRYEIPTFLSVEPRGEGDEKISASS